MAAPKISVTNRRRGFGPGALASYGDHRTCAAAACGTQLSRYNAMEICAVHQVPTAS